MVPLLLWSLTPFAGAVSGGDLAATTLSPGVALAAGGRHVALEVELAFDDLVTRTTGPRTAAVVGSGNVLYRPWHAAPITPYVTAGGSLARLRRSDPGGVVDSAVVVGFNVGGGGSVALGARLALRADVRFVHLDDAPNYWRSYAGLSVQLTRGG